MGAIRMTATQQLFAVDSYLRSFTATVVEVVDHGILLDRTAFYSRGGGQMADRGVMKQDDQQFRVIAVEKRGDQVVHTLDGPLPRVGEIVRCDIDWDFRYQMMRTHTALHVLCGVIYHAFGAYVTGCQMYEEYARMDFALADVSRDRIAAIDGAANEAIRQGLPVRVRFMSRSDADRTPELIRTKVNLVPKHIDPIRIVDIVGLDMQADGGTHVANTLEVIGIRIIKTENKGKENRRLTIELSPLTAE